MRKPKRGIAAVWGLLGLFCSMTCAQPPSTAKPAPPPLTTEEMEKIFGKPTRISVNFQNTSVEQAFAEVERQSAIRISGIPSKPNVTLPAAKPATVTWQGNDLPFWSVVERLASDSGLQVSGSGPFVRQDARQGALTPVIQLNTPWTQHETQRNDNRAVIRLIPQQIHPYIALAWSGASRTTTQGLSYGAFLPDGGSRPSRSTSLSAAVLLDPHLQDIAVEALMRLDSVMDGHGKPLSLENVRPYAQHAQGLVQTFTIPLPAESLPPDTSKLSLIKGAVILNVETHHTLWEVTDPLKAKETTKTFPLSDGSLTLTLQDVTGSAGRYAVQLYGKRSKEPERAPNGRAISAVFGFSMNDWMNRIQLLDDKGIEYSSGGGSASSNDAGFDVRRHFHVLRGIDQPTPGPPHKLIIEVPTEIRQLEIPFEIKDLPLP